MYGVGRYFIGPDFEFKIFPADLHYVEVEDAKIFTSDKLEVSTYIARASKRMFAGRNKPAVRPRGQAETSLEIEDFKSNKITGKLSLMLSFLCSRMSR